MKDDIYKIDFSKSARKFIDKQSEKTRRQIYEAVDRLPWSGDIKPIEGMDGVFRLRVRGFRILYTVDHGKLLVLVIDIDNRGDIYK